MKLIQTKDYDDMSRKAAIIIAAQVVVKKDSVLGLATGSTVIGAYQNLVKWYKKGDLDFSRVTSVNLDEYVGLTGDHDQSYRYFMNDNLFNHINIDVAQTHVPSGTATDPEAECKRYDALIESLGGQDLQLLGLGHNGHIGFNEPANDFIACTNCVVLKESTITANKRFFAEDEQVPEKALTMGIGTIMKARHILLCVSGEGKAEILKKVLYGPVTPQVPGSILQLHPHVTVVADADALSHCVDY